MGSNPIGDAIFKPLNSLSRRQRLDMESIPRKKIQLVADVVKVFSSRHATPFACSVIEVEKGRNLVLSIKDEPAVALQPGQRIGVTLHVETGVRGNILVASEFREVAPATQEAANRVKSQNQAFELRRIAELLGATVPARSRALVQA